VCATELEFAIVYSMVTIVVHVLLSSNWWFVIEEHQTASSYWVFNTSN